MPNIIKQVKVPLSGVDTLYDIFDADAQNTLSGAIIEKGTVSSATGITSLTNYKTGWAYKATADFTLTDVGNVYKNDYVIAKSDYSSAYSASDWRIESNTYVTYDDLIEGTLVEVVTSINGSTGDVVLNSLTFGDKTYNGSSAQTITAADLGLSQAMKFIGITTTDLTDGATTNPITINGNSVTATDGNVTMTASTAATLPNTEFVWANNKWNKLGDAKNYKIIQTPVSDPTASGSAMAFIDSISQNANGEITVTKKNVNIEGEGTTLPQMDGTASTGTATTLSKSDHVHPSDTSKSGVTLNGGSSVSTSVSIYAPTDSGTAGQFLVSGGSGVAPTWATVPNANGQSF